MVTRALPVESGGTMIVVRRLLDNFAPDEVVVLGRTVFKPRLLKTDKPLEYPHYEIPTPQIKGYRFWRLFSIIPGFFQGLWITYRHDIKVIIGVYPDEGSLLLAFILSKITGRPLMAYFCDLYMENKKNGFHASLARWLQPRVFSHAKRIMAANQGMKTFYDRTYGIDTLLMPTAINVDLPTTFNLPASEKPFIIGYSGSVVIDRLDPMQALVRAIGGNKDYEIRLFTPQKETYLKSVDLWADNVKIRFCASQDELVRELAQCHVLYLPLTFKTEHNSREQLATCFGIKSYEYFLSCRPVVVHCPPDYFTSTFFTSQDCGLAVDSLNEKDIMQVLENIQRNYPVTGRRLAENALVAARGFEGRRVSARLTEVLNTL